MKYEINESLCGGKKRLESGYNDGCWVAGEQKEKKSDLELIEKKTISNKK